MNSNTAKAALALLERVQLQGSEVEAYMAVRHALRQIAEGTQEPEDSVDE